jgi:hypothetical protein
MELSTFLQTLLYKGEVSIQGQLIDFDGQDLEEAKNILQQFHERDALEMPYTPPAFEASAAIWAAGYFYKAVQLTVLREIKEEELKKNLSLFQGMVTPAAIYSVDLVFRHLPALLHLAKGLAPEDLLVVELKNAATQWPFSSVGIDIENKLDHTIIFENDSLKYTYVNRIIQSKDKKRITDTTIENCLYEIAGEHLNVFWPNYEPLQNSIHAATI